MRDVPSHLSIKIASGRQYHPTAELLLCLVIFQGVNACNAPSHAGSAYGREPGALMQDAPETTAAGLVERQGRTGPKDENRGS
ncbi:hypothetical protein KM92DES2_20294 [uncultured Desulfovibrio sp.]|uniref:Uncharacterized protein n=1 Tax=uncultured Desulfovibrio sp. TaxID=167968 RepID=A0A212KJX0_9BACT|nr:hypothetical protein KM92DES2_20294 [uncultured Desulfovibrio sp.]